MVAVHNSSLEKIEMNGGVLVSGISQLLCLNWYIIVQDSYVSDFTDGRLDNMNYTPHETSRFQRR